MKFAAFIMTFERENILRETIDLIKKQTIPPEKILIVDNSNTDKTEILIRSLKDPIVHYYRVGHNSGPAGAAKIGLKILANEGYEWIYWGDDDDPPNSSKIFETLLNIANSNPNCGSLGSVGQFFNRTFGIIDRVPDEVLEKSGVLHVDTIAGGMSKIINGEMIRKHNILPDDRLFFGFEELDYDLSIKATGYELLVDKDLFHNARLSSNRIGFKRKFLKKKGEDKLWREYYSIRGLLYIFHKHKLYRAFFFTFARVTAKMAVNYRFGIRYGTQHAKICSLAIFHFFTGKMGKNIVNKNL